MQDAASTAAPNVLGEARSYSELVALFRKRCAELGTARGRIDDIAGLPTGYVSKVFAHKPVKSFGRVSLGPLLGALGVALLLIEDAEALAKVKRRLVPSDAGSRVLARKRRKRFSLFRGNPDLARRIRHLQILQQTPQQRQRIAKQAANARWAKRLDDQPA